MKVPADNLITKSLDNIVGNLWQQARQDSSGSSAGNQVRRILFDSSRIEIKTLRIHDNVKCKA